MNIDQFIHSQCKSSTSFLFVMLSADAFPIDTISLWDTHSAYRTHAFAIRHTRMCSPTCIETDYFPSTSIFVFIILLSAGQQRHWIFRHDLVTGQYWMRWIWNNLYKITMQIIAHTRVKLFQNIRWCQARMGIKSEKWTTGTAGWPSNGKTEYYMQYCMCDWLMAT